jgi:hypothetical protein
VRPLNQRFYDSKMISTETDNAVISALYAMLTALSTPMFSCLTRAQEYLYFVDDSAVNSKYNLSPISGAVAPGVNFAGHTY